MKRMTTNHDGLKQTIQDDDLEKNIENANQQQALLHQLFLFIYIYKPFS